MIFPSNLIVFDNLLILLVSSLLFQSIIDVFLEVFPYLQNLPVLGLVIVLLVVVYILSLVIQQYHLSSLDIHSQCLNVNYYQYRYNASYDVHAENVVDYVLLSLFYPVLMEISRFYRYMIVVVYSVGAVSDCTDRSNSSFF